jgi:hypothetical protein
MPHKTSKKKVARPGRGSCCFSRWIGSGMRSQGSAGAPVGEASTDVRELYRALLIWAKAHGERRSVSTTAHEFAMQLSRTLSTRRLQISQLTEYYTRERYAERRCTPAETQEARRLLEDITAAATLHKNSRGQ